VQQRDRVIAESAASQRALQSDVRSLTTRLETTTLERNIANTELLRLRASLTASQEEHAAYVKARQAELDAQSKVS
jgi:hypothetical protein